MFYGVKFDVLSPFTSSSSQWWFLSSSPRFHHQSPAEHLLTCTGNAKKPGLFLRVSSEGLSLLITETGFLFPIVNQDSAMKELTQFFAASHKRRLMQLSQVHTCVRNMISRRSPKDTVPSKQNRHLIDI